jgi:methylthioribose-1-phosphate isomerase
MADEPVPPDSHRRRFFRLFAGDVATSVGSMIGAARSLQAESASAARELLGVGGVPSTSAGEGAPASTRAQGPYLANTAGYRAPFRFEDDAVFAWDQRQLPDILQEIEIAGASDGISAITDGVVVGAAVQAQLAAAVVALVAARAWDSRPFARRATIRGSANAFRMNRPASAQMGLALDRMLAIVDDFPVDVDGKVLADALRREAEEIIIEATEDHGSIAQHAPDALPASADATLHVLTTGSTGALGSGVFGTALGVITSRHHAGQQLHVLVAESRPWLVGARVACWELAQAGVPHSLVTDAAAPSRIAAGEVEAVLVSADRVAKNGDLAAPVGAYPLALAAQAAGVPFIVCVATTAIDAAAASSDDLIVEDARPSMVLTIRGQRIAPEGAHIRNPVTDLVPATMISAFVTDEGILRQPFEPALVDALARSSTRRMAARGFRALTEQRLRTKEEATAAENDAASAAHTEWLSERQRAIREMASGLLAAAPLADPAAGAEESLAAEDAALTPGNEARAAEDQSVEGVQPPEARPPASSTMASREDPSGDSDPDRAE